MDKRRRREEDHKAAVDSAFESTIDTRLGYERDDDPYKGKTDKDRRMHKEMDEYQREREGRTEASRGQAFENYVNKRLSRSRR